MSFIHSLESTTQDTPKTESMIEVMTIDKKHSFKKTTLSDLSKIIEFEYFKHLSISQLFKIKYIPKLLKSVFSDPYRHRVLDVSIITSDTTDLYTQPNKSRKLYSKTHEATGWEIKGYVYQLTKKYTIPDKPDVFSVLSFIAFHKKYGVIIYTSDTIFHTKTVGLFDFIKHYPIVYI